MYGFKASVSWKLVSVPRILPFHCHYHYLITKALVDREKNDRDPPILGEIMIGDPDQDPYFKMDRDPDPDHFPDRLCNI